MTSVLYTSVAPYVGAWIETCSCDFLSLSQASHPTWVRGLKQKLQCIHRQIDVVAPYVGAWIETDKLLPYLVRGAVAPYVGAWIETLKYVMDFIYN